MPKEIVHLWLADRVWDFFQSIPSLKLSTAGKILFLIGSLFPDSFFYSPFSAHYSLGDNLHELEGKAFYEVVKGNIWNSATPEEKLFLAGMMTHFLADGHWHPTINDVAQQMAEKLPGGFSQVFYHRLLESFMQAHLIDRPKQDEWIKWLGSNYTKAIPVATTVMAKLVPFIGGRRNLSTADIRIIIFCHETSLRSLHSSVMRERREWFVTKLVFQSFSPLIPPPNDDLYNTFTASIPAESHKVAYIFSHQTVEDYVNLVSSLSRELP
jgi:hypothetical protein